jgi:hypothetical protein
MNTIFGKDSVKLPKIGRIRYRKHKRMRGKLKTVTIIRESKAFAVRCARASAE